MRRVALVLAAMALALLLASGVARSAVVIRSGSSKAEHVLLLLLKRTKCRRLVLPLVLIHRSA